MHKQVTRLEGRRLFFAFTCATVMIFSSFSLAMQPAHAAGLSLQTGYYVGNGTTGHAISGLGFQPQTVFIKAANLSTQYMALKTSAMPAATTGSFGPIADSSTTDVTFTTDGFSLSSQSNVNAANIIYIWTAFSGSDCSATGAFCVGTYTGTGASSRSISVGFQPAILMNKRANAVPFFKTTSMPAGYTDFLSSSTAANTTGAYISQLTSTGFDVGSSGNLNGAVYYYIAIKASSTVSEGTYTGNATDARAITGLGFQPSAVIVKNSTSSTASNRRSVLSNIQNNGDDSTFMGDAAANITSGVEALQSDGFQVGTNGSVNESGATVYWMAFGGAPTTSAGSSGTYKMATGSYTGTGVAQSVTGLSFKPDLVLIKDGGANYMVFKTSLMAGNTTGYMSAAAGDFSGGITAINSDGFSVGTASLVNTNADVYQWQAFGNAYNPETKSGAADFAIGDYYGTGINGKSIIATPFQMDFIAIKNSSNSTGVFRTSSQSGDTSGFFGATAESSGLVQGFTPNGFQLGTNATVNAAGSVSRWWGFKASSNFAVGNYTGTGVTGNAVTIGSGIQPDLVWVKSTTALSPLSRPSTLTGDVTQYITPAANVNDRITALTTTGITVGGNSEANGSGITYRYMAWRVPASGSLSVDVVDGSGNSVATPNYAMGAVGFPYICSTSTGTLGVSTQKIRVSNTTAVPGWSLSMAATYGPSASWQNGGNTQQYDYNDSTSAGCSDGSDADLLAGQLHVNPSGGTIVPQTGCTATGLSLGSPAAFDEGVTDAVTIASATSSAATQCYWDITGIGLSQTIPANQPSDNYSINLTLTLTAS